MRTTIIILSLLVALPCTSWGQMQMGMRGKGKPLYAPQQLDSLFYWFKADEGVFDSLGNAITTDDVGIAEWRDFSGNNYHVTQTTNGARPVYKTTGGPGSKPAIQFDGTNDFLASAAHFWGSDDLTVIVVMKFANATRNATDGVVGRYQSATERQWWFYGGVSTTFPGTFRVDQAGDGTLQRQVQSPNNFKHTTWKVHSWANNGTSAVTLFSDGSSVSLTTTGEGNYSILDLTSSLEIGAVFTSATPTAFLQGSISEIIVYSRALSADERVGVEQYLKAKYSL